MVGVGDERGTMLDAQVLAKSMLNWRECLVFRWKAAPRLTSASTHHFQS